MNTEITYNTTWDDIERQFRSCENETVRNIIEAACEEIDDHELTISVFEEVIADSRWDNIEDVVKELEDLSDLIDKHEFSNSEEFVEHYHAVVFELNFRRLFKL